MIKTVRELRKALESVLNEVPVRIRPPEEGPDLYVPLEVDGERKIFSVSVHEVEETG